MLVDEGLWALCLSSRHSASLKLQRLKHSGFVQTSRCAFEIGKSIKSLALIWQLK
jgi:hypothetical protein